MNRAEFHQAGPTRPIGTVQLIQLLDRPTSEEQILASSNNSSLLAPTQTLALRRLRTENLSFSLSLKELNTELTVDRNVFLVHRTVGPDLVGNLGLREWIDASLYPAVRGDLLAGNHPAPGTGAKQSSPQIVGKPAPITGGGAAALVDTGKTPQRVADMQAQVDKAVHAELDAANSFQGVIDVWKNVGAQLKFAETLEAGYSRISTPETVRQLRTQRQTFEQLWQTARGIRECTLRQLCGADYGSCVGFSGPGAEGPPGTQHDDCRQSAKCDTPDKPNMASGARASRACAEAASAEGDKDPAKVCHMVIECNECSNSGLSICYQCQESLRLCTETARCGACGS